MYKSILFAILFSLLSVSLYGQEESLNSTDKASLRKDSLFPALLDPTGESGAQAPNPKFRLEATTEGQKAVGSIGYNFGDLSISGNLSTERSEEGKEVYPVDLGGLSGDAELGITLQYMCWSPTYNSAKLQPIFQQFTQITNHKGAVSMMSIKDTIAARKKSLLTSQDTMIVKRLEGLLHDINEAVDWGPVWVFSLSGEIARNNVDYLTANYTPQDSTGTLYSLSAELGVLFDPIGYVGITWKYNRDFDGGDVCEYFLPVDTANANIVKSHKLSKSVPEFSNKDILQAEYRKYISEHIGVAVRFDYALREKEWGVDVPIYFLQDKSGGLSGGVRLGYTSTEKEFIGSIFFGSVLGLIP